jgi:large subunit ribosomal protein L6
MSIKIKIPEGVQAFINEEIKVEGPNGSISRRLVYPGIKIEKEGDEIVLRCRRDRRRERAIVGTFSSHIKNMIKGVTKGFEYKMRVVYSHFPINVKVSGKEIIVENFLGEKTPRKTRAVGSSQIEVKGSEIIVKGIDIEEVGQTAANIERLTKIRRRDRRVFQDGIYLVERNGIPV